MSEQGSSGSPTLDFLVALSDDENLQATWFDSREAAFAQYDPEGTQLTQESRDALSQDQNAARPQIAPELAAAPGDIIMMIRMRPPPPPPPPPQQS